MKAPLTIPTWTVSAPSEVANNGTIGIRMYEPKKQKKLMVQTVKSTRPAEGLAVSMNELPV